MRLSWSSLSLLSRCGIAWEFRYVKKIRTAATSLQIRGNAVDDAASTILRGKLADVPVSLEEAQDVAADSAKRRFSAGVRLLPEQWDSTEKKIEGEVVDSSTALTGAFHGQVAPEVDPIEEPQRRFEIEIPSTVTIVGRWDYRSKAEIPLAKPRIHDLKVRSKSPSKGEAEKSEQLTIYALAAYVGDGSLPHRVRQDVLVETPGGKTRAPKRYAVSQESTRSKEDFPRMIQRVENALRVIETGSFVPAMPGADWICDPRYCPYWNDCKFVRGFKQV